MRGGVGELEQEGEKRSADGLRSGELHCRRRRNVVQSATGDWEEEGFGEPGELREDMNKDRAWQMLMG